MREARERRPGPSAEAYAEAKRAKEAAEAKLNDAETRAQNLKAGNKAMKFEYLKFKEEVVKYDTLVGKLMDMMYDNHESTIFKASHKAAYEDVCCTSTPLRAYNTALLPTSGHA